MSEGAIFLHFGHIASADAAFFLATLVYVPVGAIALVAAMDVRARNGVGVARRFMARHDQAEARQGGRVPVGSQAAASTWVTARGTSSWLRWQRRCSAWTRPC